MADQRAELIWTEDQIPVSDHFDDPYYSLQNGLEETRHVFLAGNDMPARFAPGFRIAELGFGTGLNMLTVWSEWEKSGQTTPLIFTSFEAFPMAPEDMSRALAAFPEVAPWSDRFLAQWNGGRCDLGTLHLEVIEGDARQTLPDWSGRADAWFLDGFSPAKNPELWEADLMRHVADHTASRGTAATYTAAGFVRRGLEDAGFDVSRTPGFGRKRHMTRAIKA
ncbi:tRNA 5-methylaminomethyl-2-thiouridine biosynthesis bifunctional protein MnmC [Ruegeria denitrificans]|uniref:tRNA 5-methylaminomethyl-2-thiouridine biosynthesis bifunctional protein MnmC n=1 Tax=Ruegeria denitrificans TaxID=1715692 RepID=A0A0P1IG89_9RHOB|nr:tRNA (5-methylaminomethyl-2-thiouridine)(34)-methyltransferase MnmD [Ruegeria denitrificans]CUK11399.1 tRNA 5-methylaminomethyl-2-thiouridine biosynthesis bifunctional protein MnmC [Ruegeria denitrificans]